MQRVGYVLLELILHGSYMAVRGRLDKAPVPDMGCNHSQGTRGYCYSMVNSDLVLVQDIDRLDGLDMGVADRVGLDMGLGIVPVESHIEEDNHSLAVEEGKSAVAD